MGWIRGVGLVCVLDWTHGPALHARASALLRLGTYPTYSRPMHYMQTLALCTQSRQAPDPTHRAPIQHAGAICPLEWHSMLCGVHALGPVPHPTHTRLALHAAYSVWSQCGCMLHVAFRAGLRPTGSTVGQMIRLCRPDPAHRQYL